MNPEIASIKLFTNTENPAIRPKTSGVFVHQTRKIMYNRKPKSSTLDDLASLSSKLAAERGGPIDEREYALGLAFAYGLTGDARSRLLGLARGLRLAKLHCTNSADDGRGVRR